ncbi:MAG: hypothetical protein CMF50_05925 [Legionellales bacterium]|nr:hypothetical protein [Legionellales bacterium]|tara:strand:- start:63129 stop:65570 length:2442 start_codon:yes stop_codon:yes gene_type:complete
MLATIIDNAASLLPLVWPLQQSVAVNPLEDLTRLSIDDANREISRYAGIPLTQSLTELFQQQQTGLITESHLASAISEFLTDTTTHLEDVDKHMLSQWLYEFLTDTYWQQQIIDTCEQYRQQRASVSLLSKHVQPNCYDNLFALTQKRCIKWIMAYFSDNSVTDADNPGLFSSWQHHIGQGLQIPITATDTLDYIAQALQHLGIPETHYQRYINDILWQLKGWAGYIKWQNAYADNPWANQPASIADLIALWLAHELHWHAHNKLKPYAEVETSINAHMQNVPLLSATTCWQTFIAENQSAPGKLAQLSVDTMAYCWLWQRASEIQYHSELQQQLQTAALATTQYPQDTEAEWVLCIDPRSEPLRRAIEASGNYRTLGYAGFFGITLYLDDPNQDSITCQCPALLSPAQQLQLTTACKGYLTLLCDGLQRIVAKSRKGILAPFVLFEMIGLWNSIMLLYKNYLHHLTRFLTPQTKASSLDATMPDAQGIIEQLGFDACYTAASQFLQDIGHSLSAPVVVLCGHSASTTNNPFNATLDCGACGGNSGYSNALIACALLNTPVIKQQLIDAGLLHNPETVFVAACHETTTNTVHWSPTTADIAEPQQNILQTVKQATLRACQQLATETEKLMPIRGSALTRSTDWAELVPELGLANNAAMIIADRVLTCQIDLKRRVFLHSYDEHSDPDGNTLFNILQGPVIVAHWINMQYYFSAVDGKNYSSGNKAIHNVIPNVGVMEGNSSDLKFGLPEQSLRFNDTLLHTPVRLQVIVDCSQTTLDATLAKLPKLKQLIQGKWLFLDRLENVMPFTASSGNR